MRKRPPPPSILSFTDYRRYLRSFYGYRKRHDRRYSFGAFALRAGLRSRSHLKLVIEGARSLSDRTVSQYVKGLGLGRKEADYFRALVHLESAATEPDRQKILRVLRRLRSERSLRAIPPDRLVDPAQPTVRATVFSMRKLEGFRPDPLWISARTGGRISPSEARGALDFLISRRYLRFSGKKLLRSSSVLIQRGDFTSGAGKALVDGVHRLLEDPGVPTEGYSAPDMTFTVLTRREADQIMQKFREWKLETLPMRTRPRKGELCLIFFNTVPLTTAAPGG